MSEGSKKTQFKPGQSGNPAGRVKLPEEVVQAQKLNKASMTLAFNKFLTWPVEDLESYCADKSNPVLESIIAKILVGAHKNGDHMRFNFILDRLVGKVSDKVEHSMPKPTVVKLFGEDAVVVLGSAKGGQE